MRKRLIIAWIKKYIFKIKSPTLSLLGFPYEYDYLRNKEKVENAIYNEQMKWIKEMSNRTTVGIGENIAYIEEELAKAKQTEREGE